MEWLSAIFFPELLYWAAFGFAWDESYSVKMVLDNAEADTDISDNEMTNLLPQK